MDDKTRDEMRLCVDRVLARDMERRRKLLTETDESRRPKTRLAIVGVKRWNNGQTILAGFLDGESSVQQKVMDYAKRWESYANLKLEFDDDPDADIRISFEEPGSWSYIGTDARAIEDPEEPTMNFGWLTPTSSDDEYERVVLHEFGHALGAIHEHQSPGATIPWDRQAVIDYYTGPPNMWSEEQVHVNLFKLYDETNTQFSKFDTESIMLYPIPAEFVTDDAFAVGFNRTLSETDKGFMRVAYPGATKEPSTLEVDREMATARIGAHGEEDVFEFDIHKPGTYRVLTTGSTDTVMRLMGPNNPNLLLAEDDDSGAGLNPEIEAKLSPGKYFVKVSHYWSTKTGEYEIGVRSTG